MRRDPVSIALLVLAFVCLVAGASTVLAFTPEELMGERQIAAPVCKDGVCTMKEDDLLFIFQRGRLMEEIANRLNERVQRCNGGRSV